MFEEFYRRRGTIEIPSGYEDSKPKYEQHPVRYFSNVETIRDPADGSVSHRTYFLCKDYESENLPPNARFTDAAGNTFKIISARLLYNHFDNCIEAWKLVLS